MSESEETRDLRVMLGEPRKAVRTMSGPLIISFLVVQINSFADTSWTSMLGVDPSSAVATISPIYWIVSGIGTGLGVGASTAIARRLGRREKDVADSLVTQAVAAGIILSLVLAPIIYLLLDPSISMMGADDVRGLCRAYIDPIVICTLPMVLNGIISGILRSEGAAKRSTVMLLVSAVLNIPLVPILMFGLDMGIAGAGWATSISTIVSTLVGLWWFARGSVYLRMSFRGFRIKLDQMYEVLFVGVPKATETVLISVMSMIQRIFVIICGGTVGALLYNVPWRFVSLAEVVSQAVGSAVIPIASAALGQGDTGRANTAYRYSTKIALLSMTGIAVVLFVFADWLIIPFTLSESMVPLRPDFAHVLRIYAVLIPFMGLVDIGSSILESLRKAQITMLSSFLRNIIIVAFLVVACTMSMDAIFYSLVVSEIIGAALMMWLASREFRRAKEHPETVPRGDSGRCGSGTAYIPPRRLFTR